MGRVIRLSDGSAYLTVGYDEDGAEVSVPLFADSVDEAIDDLLRVNAEYYDNAGLEVRPMPFGEGQTLLVVYSDDPRDRPMLLVYTEDSP